jgi:hypothetical protein
LIQGKTKFQNFNGVLQTCEDVKANGGKLDTLGYNALILATANQKRSSSSHVFTIPESTNFYTKFSLICMQKKTLCSPLKNETLNFVTKNCRFRIREKHVMNSLKVANGLILKIC